MKKYPRSVSVLAFLWLWSYTNLLYATVALGPFSADVQGFDFESLLYAAAAGLLGGAGRTIYSLASDKVLVGSLWREGLKDGVIAILGGMVAFVLVTYLANYWPGVFTREARMIAIVLAGASRGKWANWLGDMVSDGLGNIRNKVRGAPVADATSSSAVPLENPK